MRATSPACEPIVSQQPRMTSSTAPGSTPVRSISAARVWAARSAECTRGERAAALADRGADGVDDEGFGHVPSVAGSTRARASTQLRSRRGGCGRTGRRPRCGCGRRPGPVPPDGDPHGVADEAVGEGDVEVRAEYAGAHALLEQRDPDLAGLGVAVGEVAETVERAEVVGLVLDRSRPRGRAARSPRRTPGRRARAWCGRPRRWPGSRRTARTGPPGRSTGSRRPSTPWSRSGGRGCRTGCRRRPRCRGPSCS